MKCGNCHEVGKDVVHVRSCYAERYQQEQEAKAELAAEEGYERMLENDPITAHEEEMDRQRTALTDPINFPSIDDWARMKNESAQREAEQEERAYREKMARDEALEAASVLDGMTGSHGRDMASEKQVKYAIDLLAEREWPDIVSEQDLRNMERRQVTKLIDGLKAAPRKRDDEFRVDVTQHVPEGRYALDIEGDSDNDLVFYQIDKPTEGQWAGCTFVKQLVGAPGAFRKLNIYGMRAARVLMRVAEDPQAASLRFGKETQTCGICHSPLTNKKSRELGIGPDCRKKMGW